MKKLLIYIFSLLLIAVSVSALGISYEDETGYTFGQGVGSFYDGQAWFSGESLGSAIVDSSTMNGSFETGGTGDDFDGGVEIDDATSDNFTNWLEIVGSGRVEATATAHSGPVALMLTNTTGNTYTNLKVYQGITVAEDTLYKIVFYTRGDGTYDGNWSLYDISNSGYILYYTGTGVSGITYEKVKYYFTTPSGCTSIRPQMTGNVNNGSVVYYDNFSIEPVTSLATQSFSGNLLALEDSAGKRAYGYIGSAEGGEAKTALPNNITGITKADPGVVSSTSHGLSVGKQVYFSGLTEMTELNGTYQTVTAVGSADTFSINDTSGYGAAETTGGACGEEVTTADAQSVTIFKERGLKNAGWNRIESGFDYNDSSMTFDVHRLPGAVQW